MFNRISIALVLFVLLLSGSRSVFASDSTSTKKDKQALKGQTEAKLHHRRFIDLDGDGFNDFAPDADGDGIPNGLDPDFVPGKGGRLPVWTSSVPDSAKNDSLKFASWWKTNNQKVEWRLAWKKLQRIQRWRQLQLRRGRFHPNGPTPGMRPDGNGQHRPRIRRRGGGGR